jgi:CelD/BcsL family acetyltransferase involved in cellulose biosynthesis
VNSFLLPIAEVHEADLGRWRELASRALEPNPFFEPEFVLPATARLDPASAGALLVVASGGGDWLACLPVCFSARWKRLPIAALATWRHLYCFLGTPLVAPEQPEETLAQLVDRGLTSGERARMLVLEWVRADGPVAPALRSAIEARSQRPVQFDAFERAALERTAAPDYVDRTLRPHHRRELRRLGRRLAEEMGAPLEVRDVSHDAAMIDRFIELEAAGWKGRRGTALAAKPGHDHLFREVCAEFRDAGRLQLLALTAADRPAALKCNLLAGDEVFCFKIAYDESLARFSPGVQLEERTVTVFHEQMSQRRMDSCAAFDNEMINRLWPDRRPLMSYAIPTAGASGWAAMRGLEAAYQVHNRLRRAS